MRMSQQMSGARWRDLLGVFVAVAFFLAPSSGQDSCAMLCNSRNLWKECKRVDGEEICECIPGHKGRNCKGIDHCHGRDCGMGTCVDLLNDYECVCVDGVFGRHCDDWDRNECASQPCQNGGQCADRIYGYDCVCPASYAGPNCELKIPDVGDFKCGASVCGGVGTQCRKRTDSDHPLDTVTCSCQEGYEGRYCGIKTSNSQPIVYDCGKNNPCKNGGTCVIEGESEVVCRCTSLWLGDTCEIEESEYLWSMKILHKGSEVLNNTSIDVFEGSSLSLVCIRDGREGDFRKRWSFIPKKGASTMVGSSTIYRDTNVQFSNAGTYSCNVTSASGRYTMSASVDVNVVVRQNTDDASEETAEYVGTVTGIVFLSLFALMFILVGFAWFVHKKEVAERRFQVFVEPTDEFSEIDLPENMVRSITSLVGAHRRGTWNE